MTTQSPSQSRDSTKTVSGSAQDLKDEAVASARDLKDRATEQAGRQINETKAGVAEEISGIGDALRRAADEMRSGSAQERTFGQMASALADASDTIRDKDLGELAGDISNFARRNPLAFLGGAALLGFAGTRLARASQRHKEDSLDLRHPWGSDQDDEQLEAAIRGNKGPSAPRASAYNPAELANDTKTSEGVKP